MQIGSHAFWILRSHIYLLKILYLPKYFWKSLFMINSGEKGNWGQCRSWFRLTVEKRGIEVNVDLDLEAKGQIPFGYFNYFQVIGSWEVFV